MGIALKYLRSVDDIWKECWRVCGDEGAVRDRPSRRVPATCFMSANRRGYLRVGPFPVSRGHVKGQEAMAVFRAGGKVGQRRARQQVSPVPARSTSGLPPKSWPETSCIPPSPSASLDTLRALPREQDPAWQGKPGALLTMPHHPGRWCLSFLLGGHVLDNPTRAQVGTLGNWVGPASQSQEPAFLTEVWAQSPERKG